MEADLRARLLAGAILASVTGIVLAQGRANKDAEAGQPGGRGDAGASTQSLGAGGLTGTGATQDGARTGASGTNPATGTSGAAGTSSPASNSASPAPGTTR